MSANVVAPFERELSIKLTLDMHGVELHVGCVSTKGCKNGKHATNWNTEPATPSALPHDKV